MLLTTFSFSQKETNNWFFGNNAWLDFNSGSPVSNAGSVMQSIEASTAFSDKTTGALLFYSDGITVWDNTHTMMPNGWGLFGNSSTTEGAVVIPQPGTTNIFILFTLDAYGGYFGSYGGLSYSIIDMTLNGGKGDVTTKNQPLYTPASEQLSAVLQCNGTDYWVATHKWNSDSFYVFSVTAAGVGNPVISKFGPVFVGTVARNNAEAAGQMKFSPDGQKLALVCGQTNNNLMFCNFNNETGVLSGPTFATVTNSYGLSFSPNSSKLYVSSYTTPRKIEQYNMSAGNGAAILASKTTVASKPSSQGNYGLLQLASDGKLYVAEWPYAYISVFNNPDLAGAACNYSANSIILTTGTSQSGLPVFIESYFDTSLPIAAPDAGNNVIIAYGASTTLTASGSGSYTWSPATGLSCTACKNPVASPLITTTYYVTNCHGTDSVVITVEESPVPCGELFIPNAFSPNEDGNNEILYVKQNCIQTMKWEIFNRWGEKVFESIDVSKGWDGTYNTKRVDSGIYYYVFKAVYKSGEEVKREGNVALLR